MLKIESNKLTVCIDELGAQMSSIYLKEDGTEFLWQKDPDYWKSSAPVPFPIIGKLNNMETLFDGEKYSMKSNGIIRYEIIPVVEKQDSIVEFLFTNTEDAKKMYPFDCRVKIRYELIDNKLIVTTHIMNDDNKTMYFNYAGHPGFRTPLYDNETCNDYYIEFEKNERVGVFALSDSGQLLPETVPFFENENKFFIRKDLFMKEALGFRHPVSNSVSIKSITNSHEVKLNFEGFDNLAIWSPYVQDKDLKFVCLEPWVGHSDYMGNVGEFKNRDEVASLEAGQCKEYTYTIEIK